jgi:hypothetical protein
MGREKSGVVVAVRTSAPIFDQLDRMCSRHGVGRTSPDVGAMSITRSDAN